MNDILTNEILHNLWLFVGLFGVIWISLFGFLLFLLFLSCYVDALFVWQETKEKLGSHGAHFVGHIIFFVTLVLAFFLTVVAVMNQGN